MFLTVYFIVSALINVVLILALFGSVNITFISVVPVATIIVEILMAFVFKSAVSDNSMNNIAYNTSQPVLTEKEIMDRSKHISEALFMAVPLQIPFVFFFANGIKYLSIIIFVVSLMVGGIVFKIKVGHSIKTRQSIISSELEEQKKKEEMGKL